MHMHPIFAANFRLNPGSGRTEMVTVTISRYRKINAHFLLYGGSVRGLVSYRLYFTRCFHIWLKMVFKAEKAAITTSHV